MAVFPVNINQAGQHFFAFSNQEEVEKVGEWLRVAHGNRAARKNQRMLPFAILGEHGNVISCKVLNNLDDVQLKSEGEAHELQFFGVMVVNGVRVDTTRVNVRIGVQLLE